MITVDAKKFNKQMQGIGLRIEKAAAVSIAKSTSSAEQHFLKFDDVESSVVTNGMQGSVGMAGVSLDNSEYSLPALTDMLAIDVADELHSNLTKALSEAFKNDTT